MTRAIRDLRVDYRRVSDLTPFANNARTHSAKQVRQIADSIKAFGWTNPILTDAAGGVIAGHGRLEAARLLGLDTVPTISLADRHVHRPALQCAGRRSRLRPRQDPP